MAIVATAGGLRLLRSDLPQTVIRVNVSAPAPDHRASYVKSSRYQPLVSS